MASALEALTVAERRNVARLETDAGFVAFRKLAEHYRDEKVQWAAKSVFTPDGISEDDRHYWRGYLAALHVITNWPTEVKTKLEREGVL